MNSGPQAAIYVKAVAYRGCLKGGGIPPQSYVLGREIYSSDRKKGFHLNWFRIFVPKKVLSKKKVFNLNQSRIS